MNLKKLHKTNLEKSKKKKISKSMIQKQSQNNLKLIMIHYLKSQKSNNQKLNSFKKINKI